MPLFARAGARLLQKRFCCEIAVGKLDANGDVIFDAIRYGCTKARF